MPVQIEDMDCAVPNGTSPLFFPHSNSPGTPGLAPVCFFHRAASMSGMVVPSRTNVSPSDRNGRLGPPHSGGPSRRRN